MTWSSTLKPGKPLQRKNPMSRGSGFKTPAAGAGLLRVAAAKVKAAFPRARESTAPKFTKPRKALKASRPKMTKIRASARMRDCTLRFEGICKNDIETTVWCHSNRSEDGKGMALKARDEEGCYGCYDCHCWLDGGYAGKVEQALVDARFDRARLESQAILKAEGLMA